MAIERAPELEQLAEATYEAYRRGDVEAIERTLSRDDAVLIVGTDPNEIWHGHDEAIEGLRNDLAAMGAEGAPESVSREYRGYREGNVGWVYTSGTFRLADGSELPARGLSVLHNEDGEWKYVQSVYAIAVPNAALDAGSPIAQALTGALR